MLRKHHSKRGRSHSARTRVILQRLPPFVWAIFILLFFVVGATVFKVSQKMISLTYSQQYSEIVAQWAEEYEVDPLLIYSFIRTESGFQEDAQSNVDARGLMQITSDTFDWIKSKIASDEDITFDDLYDPEVNIRFGTYYVSRCLTRYENDIATAAAAYHSGWGTVDALLEQEEYSADGLILDEFPYTQMKNYVFKITECYQKYNELYGSESEE